MVLSVASAYFSLLADVLRGKESVEGAFMLVYCSHRMLRGASALELQASVIVDVVDCDKSASQSGVADVVAFEVWNNGDECILAFSSNEKCPAESSLIFLASLDTCPNFPTCIFFSSMSVTRSAQVFPNCVLTRGNAERSSWVFCVG